MNLSTRLRSSQSPIVSTQGLGPHWCSPVAAACFASSCWTTFWFYSKLVVEATSNMPGHHKNKPIQMHYKVSDAVLQQEAHVQFWFGSKKFQILSLKIKKKKDLKSCCHLLVWQRLRTLGTFSHVAAHMCCLIIHVYGTFFHLCISIFWKSEIVWHKTWNNWKITCYRHQVPRE